MTNIQAIDLLKDLEQRLDDYCELNDEGKTAFRMAIEALEVFGNSEQLPSAQPDHNAEISKKVGDDSISRQEAIKALHDEIVRRRINEDSNDDGALDEFDTEAILRRLPSAQSKYRWIPCSERLPKYGCPVLWCNENGSVFVSAITVKTDHGWAIGKRHRMCKVIAWMSLPEPYQTERREE